VQRIIGNLFSDDAPPEQGERFDVLQRMGNVVIERIVSSATPEPGVYVQPQDEWVVLLRGAATVEVAGVRRALLPGDALYLPAATPHVVHETAAGSLWLAVHVHPDPPTPPSTSG